MSQIPAKLLIVDDEPLNQKLLERILDRQYETVLVNHGRAALEQIEKQTFDLVLLDIMMPGMNGFEVLQCIRSVYTPDKLPVILVSALAQDEDIVLGLSRGANDYLQKPLQPQLVLARIQSQVYLKRLNDDRDRLISELERANQVRNYLLRVASHDLKTPLHNIAMVLTLLSEFPAATDEMLDMLKVGSRSAQTMLGIIESFLDLNVLREDQITLSFKPLNLAQILSEVMLEFRDVAAEKRITFAVQLAEANIWADEQHLRQAFANLVSNAVKYSPIGSTVEVYTDIHEDINAAVVHVIDEGSGIPLEEQKNIFEPFSKVSTQPTAGELSTGIGLWIAREMMTLQNGEIGMQTAATGGSDFWLQIPLVPTRPEKKVALHDLAW